MNGEVTVIKRPRGRPTVLNQAIAEEICERIAGGESLRSICATPGFPTVRTVFRWRQADRNGFHSAYVRARELQAEHFVDEITEIADDGRNDYIERARQNGEVFVEADREHIMRSKVRIETRQWIIERILANKYGRTPQQVVVNNNQLTVTGDAVAMSQDYRKIVDLE